MAAVVMDLVNEEKWLGDPRQFEGDTEQESPVVRKHNLRVSHHMRSATGRVRAERDYYGKAA